MRYDDPNLRELLAARYVLGSMRGAARRRYEALLAVRPDWQPPLDWWQARLHLLAQTLPAVSPPKRVWHGIESRLYGKVQSTVLTWWRALALASSTIAVLLAILLSYDLVQTPNPAAVITERALVAIMNNEAAKPAWLLSLDKRADGEAVMRVVTLPGATPIAGKSFELWVLPADNSPPVSLGLMPVKGDSALKVASAVAPLLQSGNLAVSLEPEGGSPTGLPTGQVLYQGKFAQI